MGQNTHTPPAPTHTTRQMNTGLLVCISR